MNMDSIIKELPTFSFRQFERLEKAFCISRKTIRDCPAKGKCKQPDSCGGSEAWVRSFGEPTGLK